MIIRKIQTGLLEAAEEFPAVTLYGPRESGKSMLVKMAFPDKPYCSLEDPDVYPEAGTDPVGFLNNFSNGVIIDEVQRLPLLLRHFRKTVDPQSRCGRYIFTASHEPGMSQTFEASLSGMSGLIPLLPLALTELRQYRGVWDAFELMVTGSFPCVHEHRLNPSVFFDKYLKICVDRDVRALVNMKDVHLFYQFIRLAARQIGQILNYSALSKEVGVSATTIKNWIKALKAAYIAFELPPFVDDISRRVVKTSKLYFNDTGLAAFLLGIHTPNQAAQDAFREGLYENLVVTEILKSYHNAGQHPEFSFYMDTHDHSVDLIVRHAGGLIPVEIDSSESFKSECLENIDHFRKIAGKRCANGFVLYNGSEDGTINGNRVFNLIKNRS